MNQKNSFSRVCVCVSACPYAQRCLLSVSKHLSHQHTQTHKVARKCRQTAHARTHNTMLLQMWILTHFFHRIVAAGAASAAVVLFIYFVVVSFSAFFSSSFRIHAQRLYWNYIALHVGVCVARFSSLFSQVDAWVCVCGVSIFIFNYSKFHSSTDWLSYLHWQRFHRINEYISRSTTTNYDCLRNCNIHFYCKQKSSSNRLLI